MKDGVCPKCNSRTVYMQRQGITFSSSSGFYVKISTDWAAKPIKDVDHYLCTSCGYFEMYVEDKAKLEQVAKDAVLPSRIGISPLLAARTVSPPKGWKKVG